MAVPRRKHSHARQGKRRSTWKASPIQLVDCSNCGSRIRPHTVCMSCGFYRGRRILLGQQR